MKRKCILAAVFALAALALAGCGDPNIVDTAGAAVVVVRVSGPAQDVGVTPSRGELTAAGRQYTIALTDRSPLVVTVSAPGYRTVMLRLNAVDLASGRAEREVVMDRPAGATLELTVKTSAKAEQLSLRVSDLEAEVIRAGKRFTVELPDRAKDYTVTLEGEGCAARTISLPASELVSGYWSKTLVLVGESEKVLELLGDPYNLMVFAIGKNYNTYNAQIMPNGRYLVVAADDLVELEISGFGTFERLLVDASSLDGAYSTVYRQPPAKELPFVAMPELEKYYQGFSGFSYETGSKRVVFNLNYDWVGDEQLLGGYVPRNCAVYLYEQEYTEGVGSYYTQYRYRVEEGKLLPERELVAERRLFTVQFTDFITGEPVGAPMATYGNYVPPPEGYDSSTGSLFAEQKIDGEWISPYQAFRRIDLRFCAEDIEGNPYPDILPTNKIEPLGEGRYLLKNYLFLNAVEELKLQHFIGDTDAKTNELFRLYLSEVKLAPDGVYEYPHPLVCTDMVCIDIEEFRFLPEGMPEEERAEWSEITVKLSKDSPGRIVEESRGRKYYVEFGSTVDVTLILYDGWTDSMKRYFINGLTLDEALLTGDRVVRVKPDPRFDR